MATRAEAIKRIKGIPRGEHLAIAIWYREDVKGQARERHIRVGNRQADHILDQQERHHDATVGITWDTIDFWLGELQYERKQRLEKKAGVTNTEQRAQ
jgi:hypothetical protein